MPRGTHPNSLANLRPRPWQPGQSGNPAGRARGGAYISEWLNALLIVDGDGRPRYTKADLERIVTDDNAAPAMVIAARRILSAMRDGKLPRGGADPEPGRDFDRIADRIEGKPTITIRQEEPQRLPAEIMDEYVALLDQHPDLFDDLWPRILRDCKEDQMMRERLLPILQKHHPDLARALEPVETTAKALPVE
ncbi:MAG: hypothetical protein V3U29_02030 [Phycisphaeraceae bacterium]